MVRKNVPNFLGPKAPKILLPKVTWLYTGIFKFNIYFSRTSPLVSLKLKKYLIKSELRLLIRGESRTAATSKMERFVIIVNGWKPLTIITKHSNLDVAAVLGPPLINSFVDFGAQYS